MALANYTDLQVAVQTWMDRLDLSGNAADFITLAESRLNRVLRLRAQWKDQTLTATISSRSIALPADFIEPRALFLTTYGVQTWLRPFVAGTMEERTSAGAPQAWAINGSNIDLDSPADRAHTLLFRYRASFALSGGAPTNWLLTNHPDVYLFATLVEAFAFTENPAAAAAYHQRLDLAISEIKEKEARGEAIATLATDYPLAGGAFNINSGAFQ